MNLVLKYNSEIGNSSSIWNHCGDQIAYQLLFRADLTKPVEAILLSVFPIEEFVRLGWKKDHFCTRPRKNFRIWGFGVQWRISVASDFAEEVLPAWPWLLWMVLLGWCCSALWGCHMWRGCVVVAPRGALWILTVHLHLPRAVLWPIRFSLEGDFHKHAVHFDLSWLFFIFLYKE